MTTPLKSSTEPVYCGKLEHKQFPTNAVMEYDDLSSRQNKLFQKLVYGLHSFSSKELATMSITKKNKIAKQHRVTQDCLNLWKQQLVNKKNNAILKTFFPNADENITYLLSEEITSKKYVNNMSFRQLGITKLDVVAKLKEEKLLPHNFAEL